MLAHPGVGGLQGGGGGDAIDQGVFYRVIQITFPGVQAM
jgi:hypothetical protein